MMEVNGGGLGLALPHASHDSGIPWGAGRGWQNLEDPGLNDQLRPFSGVSTYPSQGGPTTLGGSSPGVTPRPRGLDTC